MREMGKISIFILMVCIGYSYSQQHTRTAKEEIEQIRELARMIRQTENPSELTVQNLLLWLQGKYDTQAGSRKARQQLPSREYLPSSDEIGAVGRPRPFQKPQTPQGTRRPSVQPQQAYPQGTATPALVRPQENSQPQRPVQQGYPENNRPQQQRPTQQGYPEVVKPQGPYPQPSDQPRREPYPAPGPSPTPGFSYPTTTYPTTTTTRRYPQQQTSTVIIPTQKDPNNIGGEVVEDTTNVQGGVNEEQGGQLGQGNQHNSNEVNSDDDDDKHPPHIHEINVQCAKDQMTITIEFNREFNGVIYSKGFYSSEKCRYVLENSRQKTYTFTVSLDSCGTQFIDQFAQGGQAYLENVLVLQNEPGIQEVWDTVRTVRCLWEGSIKQDLSVSLAIGMLSQEVVTFNGDTGRARLDIQVGKGPFAQAANGLVKIGEIMTLVVYVEGDAGFDVVVRQCQARDTNGENSIQLFDENGCVLKPKLFGSFQKTRETGNTGASIIAYAFFSAFKFPDEMDLVIECNVELCKADCEMCTDEQKVDPGRRRRRDVSSYRNATGPELWNRVSGRFRVIAPEDVAELELREHVLAYGPGRDGICMSMGGFLLSSLVLLSLLVGSSVLSATLWLKVQRSSRSSKA